MGRYSVKRYKTKRRTRDLDLIYNDLSNPDSINKLKNQPLDELKPGLGQYYCIQCAKYFENQISLDRHTKSKIHKRRVKLLKERPYTPLEAEAAAGINMEKFINSVEKYKQLENHKQENKQEYDNLINQKKDNLDAIITGIPSEEFQQQQQQQQQVQESQNANQGTVSNDQEEVMMTD
ncbi:filmanetation/polarity protein, putative [Candida dubliniensis CD36]|uniref:Filmanetation/polarity protein, putative n=1 Tax=Candida dubliniensis (strain CD36 / ATCC MYA-646 / CBS 7987 / NCPF 3949 / NRRL Y-17841) TaxID=573826 RepID=B9W732_CANDC|nr:filmanetation/polarity protein, putative [Candida dubliniensis CD36]CAX44490.1 filmanetation/polarity protein, putative [Candida dubliniensis CD36]